MDFNLFEFFSLTILSFSWIFVFGKRNNWRNFVNNFWALLQKQVKRHFILFHGVFKNKRVKYFSFDTSIFFIKTVCHLKIICFKVHFFQFDVNYFLVNSFIVDKFCWHATLRHNDVFRQNQKEWHKYWQIHISKKILWNQNRGRSNFVLTYSLK